MSDLSKRMFDLAAERDERYIDTPTPTLVQMRILHQQAANDIDHFANPSDAVQLQRFEHQQRANTISAELAYRDLEALRASVSS